MATPGDESWPFNGQKLTENGWESLIAPLSDDGFYSSPGGPDGQVYADSSGKQVKRRSGSAMVHGFYWRSLVEDIVLIPNNTSTQDRIDRIVLRRVLSTDKVTTELLQGTPAVTPVPTPLTQTLGGVWEVHVAQIRVPGGFGTTAGTVIANPVQAIAPSMVTDERRFNGTRLMRVTNASLLPTAGVPLWQEAVTGDGRKYRWDGTRWGDQAAWVPYGPYLSQSGTIPINLGVSAGRYAVRDNVVFYSAQIITSGVQAFGAGGRLIVQLPVAHAQVSSILGTFTIDTPANNLGGRTFFNGNAVQYAGDTIAALRNWDGTIIGDNPYAGDLQPGSTVSVNLTYQAA